MIHTGKLKTATIYLASAGEGSQYAYYSAGNSKVKKFNGVVGNWWERSPHGRNSTSFCVVSSGGLTNTDNASNSFPGVAFGFCF